MTIGRGTPWGEAVPWDPARPVLDGDAAMHHWITDHRARGVAVPPVTLIGGDLARTCGGGRAGHPTEGSTVTRVTLDLVRVTHDGGTTWSAAHVVARRGGASGWWRGPIVMAMNAQFLGRYDVAPRSHPNDGRVDIVQVGAAMPIRTRLQARRRARQGTHLPHPQISVRQAGEWHARFDTPLVLSVDGVVVGATVQLELVVEADAVEADIT